MSLFESLKKILNTAENVSKQLEKLSDNSNPTMQSKQTEKKAAPGRKTSSRLFETGNIPPKPSKRVNDEFGDKRYSFMLSGDFAEFNSHCEMSPSFQYEPDNNEDFTEYKENTPQLMIGPNDTIYDGVENFSESSVPVGKAYERVQNPYFLFKTKLDCCDEILYCYAFADGTAREREMFGIQYSSDIEGTPLEKKLMAALDEAVSTYSENEVN